MFSLQKREKGICFFITRRNEIRLGGNKVGGKTVTPREISRQDASVFSREDRRGSIVRLEREGRSVLGGGWEKMMGDRRHERRVRKKNVPKHSSSTKGPRALRICGGGAIRSN